jgi:2-iminobutanoate/2-iminopropanoate deaminase
MHPDVLRELAAENTRDLITEADKARRASGARHTQRRRLAARRNAPTVTRYALTSDQLPASGPPFTRAVHGGGLLFLSGQVAEDPATGELVDGDVAHQADQILRNIAATLAAIGKDLDNVIRLGVYLTDMSQLGAMNAAYGRHFAEPYPASTAIGVAALPLGAAVEIDVVVG